MELRTKPQAAGTISYRLRAAALWDRISSSPRMPRIRCSRDADETVVIPAASRTSRVPWSRKEMIGRSAEY